MFYCQNTQCIKTSQKVLKYLSLLQSITLLHPQVIALINYGVSPFNVYNGSSGIKDDL